MPKLFTTRLLLLCIFINLLTGIVFVSAFYFGQKRSLAKREIDSSKRNVEFFKTSLQRSLKDLADNTRFLASTPPIQGIKRAFRNDGIDPVDTSTISLWKARLGTIFTEMLHAKVEYFQIRYVGFENNGKEFVRVNRRGNKVQVVLEENLQELKSQSYFNEIFEFRSGENYFSEFEFSQDFGKIDKPRELILHSAVPIFDLKNKPFGFVMIDIKQRDLFASALLSSIKDERILIQDKYRILFQNQVGDLLGDPTEIVNLANGENKSENVIYLKEDIYLNKRSSKSNKLSLTHIIDEGEIEREIAWFVYASIAIAFLLTLFTGILSFILGNIFIRPLKKLLKLNKKIENNEHINIGSFKNYSKDEVSVLSNSLISLYTKINDKKIALSEQKSAIDQAAIVLETDLSGKIQYMNEGFPNVSGYSSDELTNQLHSAFGAANKINPNASIWDTIAQGKVWKGEIEGRTKAGAKYWLDTTIYPVKDSSEKVYKYIVIHFNLTSQKTLEQELSLATEKAKQAANAKAMFLANMSHEIRTPLNSIVGYADLLLNSDTTEDSKSHLSCIYSSSQMLLQLVNDILDFSKNEYQDITLEKIQFDLHKLIDEVIMVVRLKAESKSIEVVKKIEVSAQVNIVSDPLRLRQILINLLNNAVKFTSQGSVKLEIGCKNDSLVIKIIDTGIGMTPDEIERIFEPFSQADLSVNRRFGGTGLGLTIVSQILRSMQGTLSIESEKGKGSSFELNIPVEIAKNPGVQLISSRNYKSDNGYDKKLRILLVDDNEQNISLLKIYLGKSNHEICVANDGKSATETAIEKEFDIIFMDVQMPIMDGREATEKIRFHEKLNPKRSPAKIIALSANVLGEDKASLMEAGCDAYMTKPVTKVELLGMLNK